MVSLGLIPATAFCYEPKLHTFLTEIAANNSVLATNGIWSDWGYPTGVQKFPPTYQPSPTYDTNGRSFNSEWDYYHIMGYGADIEDTSLDVLVSRAFNHFYNPQPPSGEKLPSYFTVNQPNFTSADWALGVYEASGISILDYPSITQKSFQRWSYQNAGEHFYNSLASPAPADRRLAISKTIQSLGHVVHHVQDMAQPQHTRIDAHCDADICKLFNSDDLSIYEIWTGEFLKQGTINANTVAGYPVVTLNQPRDYWHNGSLQGLADFSSQNFVTTDTAFSYDACTLAANCQFLLSSLGSHSASLPQPDGDPSTTWITEVPINQVISNVPSGLANGKMTFIGRKMTDRYTNSTINVDRMATFSIFSERLTKVNRTAGFQLTNVFSVNKFNIEEQYKILLPRAVGYSTGLINHFFQYRLNIVQIPQGANQNPKWEVTNISSKAITADLQMYYDNTANIRVKLPGGNYGTRTIPAGGKITLPSFNPPADTSTNYILVASTVQNNKSIGLAAKTFTANLTTPVPCGQPVSASGGIEGYNQTHSLGTQAGSFYIDFVAYTHPDRLKVTKANGQIAAYTGVEYVSGYHTFTLNFDPATWGGPNIQIVIDSVTPETQWDLDVTCPGVTPATKMVTFTLGALDNSRSCAYDLYIAGQKLFTATAGTYHGEVMATLRSDRDYQFDLRNVQCLGLSTVYDGYPMWYRVGNDQNVRIKQRETFFVP
jgi:hypothetical protein